MKSEDGWGDKHDFPVNWHCISNTEVHVHVWIAVYYKSGVLKSFSD